MYDISRNLGRPYIETEAVKMFIKKHFVTVESSIEYRCQKNQESKVFLDVIRQQNCA